MGETRIEKDSLGEVEVPAEAYYGAQTERARRNFPVSVLRIPRRFIRAWASSRARRRRSTRSWGSCLGSSGRAIRRAAEEAGGFNVERAVS
jgi:fumarate hydratase class II